MKTLIIYYSHSGLTEIISKVLAHNLNADIVKIYNGLDIREIQNNTMDKVKYMRKINIPSDAFVVGHVGRFHKVKNHEKVISVFLFPLFL